MDNRETKTYVKPSIQYLGNIEDWVHGNKVTLDDDGQPGTTAKQLDLSS